MALLSGQVGHAVRPARSVQAARSVRSAPGPRSSERRRHPLVALAMALPVAVLLAVLFGGWAEFLTQVSPVLRMFGR
jgi:hypothetical protein